MFKPLWGAATSAHQVEGGNHWNDWWAWEQAGKVRESSGKACDHYHRFREDFRLAKSLGHTAHRFSLEWSRFEPSEGNWNEEAFRHYDQVFDALEAEGLEPVVTLQHFTYPQWFTAKGGWLGKDAAEKFAGYVRRIAQRYGKRVRFWITLNEPLIFIYQGYLLGRWPPGETSLEICFRVLRELLKAHIRAYEVLHADSGNSECWVSVAHHMTTFSPCRRGSPLDRLIVFVRERFLNQLLFRSLLSGFLFYPGIFCEKLPAKKTLDFIGVNYYTRDFIRFGSLVGFQQFGVICSGEHHEQDRREVNDLGWEIYPRGIFAIISSLARYRLPIIVTENGVCTSDDEVRQRFIEGHLDELAKARNVGVPIRGYFYWSLVDNFEWAEGFKPRFGIVEVNYTTQERIIRPSAYTLKRRCEQIFKN